MRVVNIDLKDDLITDLSVSELKRLSAIVDASLEKLSNPKDDNKLDFDLLKDYYNEVFTKSMRVITENTKKNLRKRIKEGYTKADIRKVIDNASNDKFHEPTDFKHVTLEFISRPDIFARYVSELEHQMPRNKKLLKERLEKGHTNY